MIRDVFVSIQYVMFNSMYKNIIRVSRYMRTTINKINLIISETVAIEIVPNKVTVFVTNFLAWSSFENRNSSL